MFTLRTLSQIVTKSRFTTTTRHFATECPLKTPLYDFHVENEGKMVEFAGYLMPVQYSKLSITQSHLHTRQAVSIFDVSHMLQSEIRGKDRICFMESIVTGDIGLLKPGTGTLTLFTNKNGGIIDDLIVTKTEEDYLYVVSNAGCREKDIPLMRRTEEELKGKGKDVTFIIRDDLALLAVQGPKAAAVVQPLTHLDLSKLYFMSGRNTTVGGIKGCRITRCGYTGEDGMEISVPNTHAVTLAQILIQSQIANVELAGLGARDSLRLEAGLCLYGNDMDEHTTPVEAGLGWLLGKTRKERKDFPGSTKILAQVGDKSKVFRRRIGIVTKDGPPPRAHMSIVAPGDPSKIIGEVTSGCPSPSLGFNIAMGYVEGPVTAGTPIAIKVRNTFVHGQITKIPFIKGKYYTAQ